MREKGEREGNALDFSRMLMMMPGFPLRSTAGARAANRNGQHDETLDSFTFGKSEPANWILIKSASAPLCPV